MIYKMWFLRTNCKSYQTNVFDFMITQFQPAKLTFKFRRINWKDLPNKHKYIIFIQIVIVYSRIKWKMMHQNITPAYWCFRCIFNTSERNERRIYWSTFKHIFKSPFALSIFSARLMTVAEKSVWLLGDWISRPIGNWNFPVTVICRERKWLNVNGP